MTFPCPLAFNFDYHAEAMHCWLEMERRASRRWTTTVTATTTTRTGADDRTPHAENDNASNRFQDKDSEKKTQRVTADHPETIEIETKQSPDSDMDDPQEHESQIPIRPDTTTITPTTTATSSCPLKTPLGQEWLAQVERSIQKQLQNKRLAPCPWDPNQDADIRRANRSGGGSDPLVLALLGQGQLSFLVDKTKKEGTEDGSDDITRSLSAFASTRRHSWSSSLLRSLSPFSNNAGGGGGGFLVQQRQQVPMRCPWPLAPLIRLFSCYPADQYYLQQRQQQERRPMLASSSSCTIDLLEDDDDEKSTEHIVAVAVPELSSLAACPEDRNQTHPYHHRADDDDINVATTPCTASRLAAPRSSSQQLRLLVEDKKTSQNKRKHEDKDDLCCDSSDHLHHIIKKPAAAGNKVPTTSCTCTEETSSVGPNGSGNDDDFPDTTMTVGESTPWSSSNPGGQVVLTERSQETTAGINVSDESPSSEHRVLVLGTSPSAHKKVATSNVLDEESSIDPDITIDKQALSFPYETETSSVAPNGSDNDDEFPDTTLGESTTWSSSDQGRGQVLTERLQETPAGIDFSVESPPSHDRVLVLGTPPSAHKKEATSNVLDEESSIDPDTTTDKHAPSFPYEIETSSIAPNGSGNDDEFPDTTMGESTTWSSSNQGGQAVLTERLQETTAGMDFSVESPSSEHRVPVLGTPPSAHKKEATSNVLDEESFVDPDATTDEQARSFQHEIESSSIQRHEQLESMVPRQEQLESMAWSSPSREQRHHRRKVEKVRKKKKHRKRKHKHRQASVTDCGDDENNNNKKRKRYKDDHVGVLARNREHISHTRELRESTEPVLHAAAALALVQQPLELADPTTGGKYPPAESSSQTSPAKATIKLPSPCESHFNRGNELQLTSSCEGHSLAAVHANALDCQETRHSNQASRQHDPRTLVRGLAKRSQPPVLSSPPYRTQAPGSQQEKGRGDKTDTQFCIPSAMASVRAKTGNPQQTQQAIQSSRRDDPQLMVPGLTKLARVKQQQQLEVTAGAPPSKLPSSVATVHANTLGRRPSQETQQPCRGHRQKPPVPLVWGFTEHSKKPSVLPFECKHASVPLHAKQQQKQKDFTNATPSTLPSVVKNAREGHRQFQYQLQQPSHATREKDSIPLVCKVTKHFKPSSDAPPETYHAPVQPKQRQQGQNTNSAECTLSTLASAQSNLNLPSAAASYPRVQQSYEGRVKVSAPDQLHHISLRCSAVQVPPERCSKPTQQHLEIDEDRVDSHWASMPSQSISVVAGVERREDNGLEQSQAHLRLKTSYQAGQVATPVHQPAVQVLCSEGFLDIWGDIAAELGSGRWPALADNNGGEDSVGRRVELLDTSLVDHCGVDIELPNRCAAIVYSASALDSTDDAKDIVLDVARLVASGRYERLVIFLCYDVPITDSIARHIVQLQTAALCNGVVLPTTTFFKTTSPSTLSAAIAATVYSCVCSQPRQSTPSPLEVASDSKFRNWARFLLAIVPTLCAAGALQCLLLSQQRVTSHVNALGLLVQDAQLRKEIAEAARSNSPLTNSIHPDAMDMLSDALYASLRVPQIHRSQIKS